MFAWFVLMLLCAFAGAVCTERQEVVLSVLTMCLGGACFFRMVNVFWRPR
jgi:hypothetical protein